MAETFHCTVVTPERQMLDREAAYASIPAWDGQLGVAPSRAPMLVKLGYGPFTLQAPGGEGVTMFLGGGFAQMRGNHLTLLAEEATPAEQLDADAARAALEEAAGRRAEGDDAINKRFEDQDRARGLLRTAST